MGKDTTAETLALMKAAQANPDAALTKAWTQSGSATTGITAYDLEAPAKKLYPVITPLRNAIPRTSGKGGIQANWKAITGVNTGKMSPGVSGGKRSGVIVTSVADYSAVYRGLGLEDSVDFEADYASEGFDDVKALATEGLLRSMMIGEEGVILGGNNSLALGNTPTPTLSDANTGGSLLANTAYGVRCVALSWEGQYVATVAAGVVQQVTRANADSSNDVINMGTANISAQANITTSNNAANTHVISASVTPVAGAFAYAWYWGLAAGNLVLGAVSYINSVSMSANATGTQVASTLTGTDFSRNSLLFDGLLTMCSTSALNAYRVALPTGNAGTGTPLTSDGKGGIVEIDVALQSFWDNYRLSPEEIWVNSQEQKNISSKILDGTTTSAARFVFNVDQGTIAGGVMVKSYLNKFSMNGAQEIPIRLHPNLPPGTILFLSKSIPYPLSNVGNVMQIRCRRDYYQIEWPLRTRKYEYGVYCDEVLQHYFPPSMGILTNIANG